MNSSKCYEILGIEKNASLKVIKQAYRKLSLKYHPDRNKIDRDGIRFKEITEAYQILKQNHKKERRPMEDVESAHVNFWKYYDKKMNEEFQFNNRANFRNFSDSLGANISEDQSHNKEKSSSHKITHLILYGGLSLMALWIILSELFR